MGVKALCLGLANSGVTIAPFASLQKKVLNRVGVKALFLGLENSGVTLVPFASLEEKS